MPCIKPHFFIKLLLFAAILTSTTSIRSQGTVFHKGKGGRYHINGDIKGLNNDSIVLFIRRYTPDGKFLKADTLVTKASAGRFRIEGTIESPLFVTAQLGLRRRADNFNFFLEKGTINISGAVDSLDRLSIKGTPSNNDFSRVDSFNIRIRDRIGQLYAQLKNEKEGGGRYDEIARAIELKRDSIDRHGIDFIRKYPHSYTSGILLYPKQDKLPVEELEELYMALDSDIKKTPFMLNIPQKIAARKSVAIGKKAPDFVSRDTSGKEVRLSDFKGKYVLLEFWAHWCVPCRQQGPYLVAAYNKFSDKGFTILQYSIDDKNAEQKWREAIRTDGLKWTQISDLDGFNSKVTKLYGVQPIPDNFLIDPNGIIIGRRLDGRDLEQKLNELLSK